jgi:hypothetical protein
LGKTIRNWNVISNIGLDNFASNRRIQASAFYFFIASDKEEEEKSNSFLLTLLLFCCSGTGIATAETLIDCIEEGKCHEVTSDDLPWDDDDDSTNATYTGGCKGACCHEVQKVRKTNK